MTFCLAPESIPLVKNVMEYLDAHLERLKREGTPMAAKELGTRLCVTPTVFPKWRDGSRAGVTPSTLINMQSGISNDPKIQAELLAAYLKDQCVGPGAPLIRITIEKGKADGSGGSVTELPPAFGGDDYAKLSVAAREARLDAKILKCLEKIIRMIGSGSKHLRRVLFGLAEMKE